MNDTERILTAINSVDKKLTEVSASLTKRMDSIEKRVAAHEKSTGYKIKCQQADIDALREKIAELSHSDAVVWRSQDKLETAIDKEIAYQAFYDLGIRRRDALKALEALGILVRRDKDSLLKNLYVGGKYIRAVVVLEKEVNA